MDDDAAEIAQIKGVTDKGVLSPNAAATAPRGTPVPSLVSEDGEVAYLYLTFNFGQNGWNAIPAAADRIREIATLDGGQVHLAGYGGQAADSAEAFKGIDGDPDRHHPARRHRAAAASPTAAPYLWVLPIFSVVVALIPLRAAWSTCSPSTPDSRSTGRARAILGGARDRRRHRLRLLLLVARYREELRRHENRHEAMTFALHRAAPALLASAATVAVGMLCLGIAELNSTAGLGPVNAIGVAVTFLVMVMLLPALLVIVGRWIFWPARPGFGSPEPTASGFWAKVGRRIAVRPRTVWVGTSVVLLIACMGLFKLDAHGLNSEDQYTKEFDSIKGQKVLDGARPRGQLQPAHGGRRQRARRPTRITGQAASGARRTGSAESAVVKDGVAFISATMPGDVAGQAPSTSSVAARDAVHGSPAADAWSAAGRRSTSTPRRRPYRDNKVIIPLVLVS